MSVEGNQNAAKNKPWREALNRALIRFDGGKENALNRIADQTVTLAVSGEQWAIKEIGERMDGKSAQSVAVTGEDGGAIRVEKIVRQIVDTHNSDATSV